MRIHHGYIGAFLIGWSFVTTVFREAMIGDYNPWLAAAGFMVGGVLLVHGLWCHFRGRSR